MRSPAGTAVNGDLDKLHDQQRSENVANQPTNQPSWFDESLLLLGRALLDSHLVWC